jgi:hypothetical protein
LYFFLISSCFFSSLEKILISFKSESKNISRTLFPKEPVPPAFTWVSASSSLKGYPSDFTTDGKLETAWLEGVKGNGIGEWLMYSAENDQTVSSITIYNGYLKNDKVYINNGKIKKFS